MSLILAICALVETKPGTSSEALHKLFREELDKANFNLDAVKESLDQAVMLGSLKLSIVGALASCVNSLGKPEKTTEIEALMAANEKIQAIKLYRNVFNVGLADAKEAVERKGLEMGIYEERPEGIRMKRCI